MSTKSPSSKWLWKAGLAVGIIIVALAVWFFTRPEKPSDTLNVPLGVEQAAIITYSGPPIAVTPYKWGVAVNVRIAKVTEQAGARIYDVRYIVNRPGTFDLRDFLTSDDARPLDGLPSFQFQGDPKLSKQLDARIQETEEISVNVGGHYYAKLAGLAVFWILWLLLLIFYKRAKSPQEAAPPPPEPTFAELLRGFLAQLEAGTLDSDAKAKMEGLLLRHWREELTLEGMSMSRALNAIGSHQKTSNPLRQLQDWLYRPASSVRREEIAAVLSPYTVETPKSEVTT